MEKERWRRDEARRLAIVAIRQFSSNFSQQSMLFSGKQAKPAPNPTHDGGFRWPQRPLARRTSIGQRHWLQRWSG